MNPNQLSFGCTSLAGVNKIGLLKKDEDGYYDMIVGALEVYNSAGAYYVYEQAKSIFDSSASLMRRVSRGVLKGEYGHPKFMPGMSREQYVHRIMDLDPGNVCCHHRQLRLDTENVKDKNGKPIIAIMSKVQPSGPMGEYLRASLENKHENVCFSIRAFTDDMEDRNGRVNKTLRQVITFDYVIEPGIEHAEKFKSPALEQFSLESMTLSRATLERAMRMPTGNPVAVENIRMNTQELFQAMGWAESSDPVWSKW